MWLYIDEHVMILVAVQYQLSVQAWIQGLAGPKLVRRKIHKFHPTIFFTLLCMAFNSINAPPPPPNSNPGFTPAVSFFAFFSRENFLKKTSVTTGQIDIKCGFIKMGHML